MIVFTLILYVRIVFLYYEGLEINKEAVDAMEKAQKGMKNKDEEVPLKVRQEIYQTKDGQLESRFLHWVKIGMLVAGVYVLIQIILILVTVISSAFIICFMLYWEFRGRKVAA